MFLILFCGLQNCSCIRAYVRYSFVLTIVFFRTIEHGRWASVKSARTYINEAAAEAAAKGTSELGQRRLKDAMLLCPSLLRKSFQV